MGPRFIRSAECKCPHEFFWDHRSRYFIPGLTGAVQRVDRVLWEWTFSDDLFWKPPKETGASSHRCTIRSPERSQTEDATFSRSTHSAGALRVTDFEALICRYSCTSVGAVQKGSREEIVQRGGLEAQFKRKTFARC